MLREDILFTGMCKYTFFLIASLPLQAVTIGSDSAVNLFTNQQLLQTGDRVAGFAWLQNGFTMQGLNTTATFDSFFPVSGQISLNAGNLVLNKDLVFANNSSLYTMGNIYGNNHTVELSSSVTCIPGIGSSSSISGFSFSTSYTAPRQIVVANWSYDSKYLAVGLSNGAGPELYLFSYNGKNLTLVASANAGNHVLDIGWHPSQYYMVVGRAVTGSQIAIYYINPASPSFQLISSYGLSAAGLWAQSACYNPDGTFIASGTTDTARQIVVIPINGDQTLNTGSAQIISFGNSLTMQSESLKWSNTGNYFAAGVSNSGGTFDELRVYQVTTSPTAVTLKASALVGGVPCVGWLSTSTYVILAGFDTAPFVRSYNFNANDGSLSLIAEDSSGLSVLTRCLKVDPTSTEYAITTPLSGISPEFAVYNYDPTATSTFALLTSAMDITDVVALGWSPNGNYIAYGNNNGVLNVWNRNTPAALGSCFTFSNVSLYLNGDTCIQNGCVNFSGNVYVNGRGHTLSLMSSGTIGIGTASNVMLENITITGLQGANLYVADNTSVLTIDDTTLALSGDYTFGAGNLVVNDLCAIQGMTGASFEYLTSGSLTINRKSQLLIDYGITFSYDPIASANNLIQFLDTSSTFMLSGSLLYVGSGGLQFLKGLFKVDGKSFFANSGATSAQGIIFGDGISAANDCTLEMLPGATLNVLSGYFVHKNI